MPETWTPPDYMADIRQWLRGLGTLAGTRVFFRIPTRNPVFPFVRIYQSGGGLLTNAEAPLYDIRIGLDVWGGQFSDYPKLRSICGQIEQASHDLAPGYQPGASTTRLYNVIVTTTVDSPDPESGWPRKVMDLTVTCG